MLIETGEIDPAGHLRLAGTRAAHLTKVLHVEPGQDIRIGVVDGPRGTATVLSIADDAVALRCTLDATIPPRPSIDLLLAVPRPKVMRRLWAQIAALGVGRIILTNAEKVERNYFDTHILAEDTYRPLLIEGLQQARDTRLPVVSIHRQFKVLIEDDLDELCPRGLRLVADPAAVTPMRAAAAESVEERTLLAIGPEGGWNTFEIDLLQAHGFHPAGIGPRTLRSDTACVALVTLVHDGMRSPTRP